MSAAISQPLVSGRRGRTGVSVEGHRRFNMSVHNASTKDEQAPRRKQIELENMPLLPLDAVLSQNTTAPVPISMVDAPCVCADTLCNSNSFTSRENLRLSSAGVQEAEAPGSRSPGTPESSTETDEDVQICARSSLEGVSVTIDNPKHKATEPWDAMIFHRQLADDFTLEEEGTDEPVSFDEAKKVEITQSMLTRFLMGIDKAKEKCTPLFWAIAEGNMKKVRRLISDGAGVLDLDGTRCTPLHVAALFGHLNILKYFFETFDFENSPDKLGFYPIHSAISNGNLEAVKLLIEKFGKNQLKYKTGNGMTVWQITAFCQQSNYIEEYLLQVGDSGHRLSLNLANDRGQFPLYILASLGLQARTARLLRNGAALSVEGGRGTAVKPIVRTFADPIKFLEDMFDECIYEKNDHVYVDFNILADDTGMKQIKVLEDLANSKSKVLKHPMIESLIYLKWKCLLPVFYIILATYATFLVALNAYAITTFYEKDTFNRTFCSGPSALPCIESCRWYSSASIALIYISISVLFTQECVWVYLRKRRYFTHTESWVKLCGLVMGALVPALVGCAPAPAPAPAPWQRHVACTALLLAWLQAMLLLSRFPGWGYYVLMFERVAINILKILVTSICLVVGFSTCFMIYYQSKPPFNGPVAAFVKTLIMMSSEFEYENLFGEDHDGQLTDTRTVVRLLFVAFVILIAIVLMNFMIGVAVSDINELRAIGNIRRLEKQVELISTLEGLVNTVLQKWCPRLSRLKYYIHMCNDVLSSGRKWILKYRDGDDLTGHFEQSFTKELHDAIYDIAKKNKPNTSLAKHNDEVTPHNSTLSDATSILNRIKSIEDDNKEILHANQEMKQSIDALKNDVDKILRMLEGMSSVQPRLLPKYNLVKENFRRIRKYHSKLSRQPNTLRNMSSMHNTGTLIDPTTQSRCCPGS